MLLLLLLQAASSEQRTAPQGGAAHLQPRHELRERRAQLAVLLPALLHDIPQRRRARAAAPGARRAHAMTEHLHHDLRRGHTGVGQQPRRHLPEDLVGGVRRCRKPSRGIEGVEEREQRRSECVRE